MKSLATALTLIIIFAATATAQTWDPETHSNQSCRRAESFS